MIGHDDEFIQRNIGVVRRDGADGLIYHTANGGKRNTLRRADDIRPYGRLPEKRLFVFCAEGDEIIARLAVIIVWQPVRLPSGQLHAPHPCPRSSMMRSRRTAAYSNSSRLDASRISFSSLAMAVSRSFLERAF